MPDDVATEDAGGEGAPAMAARLAELVAARMCHDLVNPVGAIGNGIELMREVGRNDEDLELISTSTARAAALLRLHRLAFGPQSAEAAALSRAELAARVAPAYAGGRVRLGIEALEGPALPAPVARLGALMALAGRMLAGQRGEVVLSPGRGHGLPLVLAVHGPGVAWHPDLEAVVHGDPAPATPRNVEFAFLPVAAEAAGARLGIRSGPEQAGLEAQPV